MRGWAIKHWTGGIYIDTVRRTRREAVEAFLQNYFRGSSIRRWTQWRDQHPANRAVRVSVEPE